MNAPSELPEGLLRNMLERFLPRGLKGEMIRGDLFEEFRALAERSSERQARAWYRRQTRRILWAVATGRITRLDLKSGVPAARSSVCGSIVEDVNYALRRFRKEPGYAAVAIMTIAIGIGANTAIFSVLDAVILRPLPFPEPERLVQIWQTNPEYVAERKQAHVDVPINALNYSAYVEQEWVRATSVSASFFSVVGIAPMIGRGFLPDDVPPPGAEADWGATGRAPPIAILTHDIWARRYGADPDIIGSEIFLNAAPVTVVGVLPERAAFPPVSFRGNLLPSDIGVYLPLSYGPFDFDKRDYKLFTVLGRVAPDRSVEEVREDLQRITLNLAEAYPEALEGWSIGVTPVHELLTRDFGSDLYTLMAIVGLVLLIACVNLAHLLLAMGSRRQAELAVRLAIGASWRRQVQLLLTESLLLASLGGVAGLVVARSALSTLLSLVPSNVPRAAEAGLDGTVLAFTVGISLATGLLFGLLPALRASDIDLVEALKGTRSANTSGRRRSSSTPLIVIQVALTLMLMVGGTVLGKSFFQLLVADRGFRSENILLVETRGRSGDDETTERVQRRWREAYDLLAAVRSMPGVISVASGHPPLETFQPADFIQFKEYEEGNWPVEEMTVSNLTYVSPGYFETLGIPIIRGGDLPEWDGVNDWRRYSWGTFCPGDICTEWDPYGKVVVSESFAAGVWPGQDPIGKELGLYDCCWTVAGVVPDVSYRRIDGHMGIPKDLVDGYRVYMPWHDGTLLVRTATDPLGFVPAIREVVRSIDDTLTIEVSTLDGRILDSLARPRFHMLIGGIFAAVALLLALVGLYGVVAYTVAQRTHEIGIRIALGARRGDIRALVVRGGLAPVVLGVALGIAGTLASVRVLEALLYGTSALDPSLIVGLAVTLVLVTAAACYVPARRASAMDPVSALTHE